MIIQHAGKRPTIDSSASVAPDATICGDVVIAAGARILHGARLGRATEVRVHATVHVRTVLPAGTTVPIGWIAVGDPAQILPPDRHDEIWTVQKPLNFPDWVYGVPRDTPDLMRVVTERLSRELRAHADDIVIEG